MAAAVEDDALEEVARAISARRRREIFVLVRDAELSAGEIASHFDVSRPAISQHLAVLREAGLLDERRDGTRRMYRARAEGLAGLRNFLDRFWTDHLERLKLAAELEQQRKGQTWQTQRQGPRSRWRSGSRQALKPSSTSSSTPTR